MPPKRAASRKLDRLGRSDLHYAAADANHLLVEQLIHDGADVNLADKNGWTPLHFAAQAQSAEAATLLLDAGAQIDSKDTHGNTPLSNAVFNFRGHGETIVLLRARGASPMAANEYGQTPVGLARLISNYDVRRFFVDLA